MAEVQLLAMDAAGFPTEHDPATDTVTFAGMNLGGNLVMNSNKITGLAPGTAGTDAVNKNQLDSVAAGFDPKESCRVRTVLDMSTWTAAGSGVGATLTAPTNSSSFNTVDGVLLTTGDRVLVVTAADTAGSADADNGIYEVTALGNDTTTSFELTRTTDFDEDAEVTAGAFTFVSEGATWADTGWYVTTNDPITVDTTAIAFSQFAGVGTFTGGNGIDISSGVISVDLATDPGLEFATGQLRVLVDPAGAIYRTSAGIGVNLEASNPSLQISTNELGVKFSASASALTKDATGLKVVVDGVTIQINGSNQLEVIGAADANKVLNQYTTDGTGVTKGDPVYFSGNGIVSAADAGNDNSRQVFGLADATVGASASVDIISEGPAIGASSGLTAGDFIYLAAGGGLTNVAPGTPNRRMLVGYAINATDVYVKTQFLGRVI